MTDKLPNEMSELQFVSEGEEQTRQLAHSLASVLPESVLLTLEGPLGAGKTTFVRYLAEAWGIDPRIVVSPTFSLCQSYQGSTRRLHHLDAYRLQDSDELDEIGLDEFLEDTATTIMEWASRVSDRLPDRRLDCVIDLLDINRRQFSFRLTGAPSGSLRDALSRAIDRIS